LAPSLRCEGSWLESSSSAALLAPTMADYFLNSMPEFTVSGDSWIRLLVIKELMSIADVKDSHPLDQ
jgi:hypothetical protein